MSKHHYSLDSCTTCASCLINCPVAAATRQFRGPKMSGPAGERFRLSETDETEYDSLKYCSNCKNCDISCPSGVPVSTLNMLAKARYHKSYKPSLRDWLLSHGEKLGKIASLTPGLANLGLKNSLNRLFLEKIGIAVNAPMPPYAAKTFNEMFKSVRQKTKTKKVVFYPGCFINFNQPEVGLDLLTVMQQNDYEVVLAPETVCCGSPLIVGGYFEEARNNAKENFKALAKFVKKGYPIITACTSCGLMLTDEVQDLFDLDGWPEIAANIYNVFEFLLELYAKGEFNFEFDLTGKYLYHAPCHLRAKGIGNPALELLNTTSKLEIVDLAAGCCGISGSYGFKKDKYDIAMTVGQNLVEAIKAHENLPVLSDCGTCRLQISHSAGVKTLHPLSVLAEGYLS